MTVFAKLPTLAELAFLIVAYVILGWDVVWQAVKNITRGQVFDEHFLMSVSTIGAFAIGEYPEAVAVMLFYQVGEFFQSLAVKRSRKSISDLMDICPDSATVKRNGVLQVVSPESVAVGEIIVVKPGEKIPLDGIVVDGESMLDTKALTGESVPRSIRKGDEALSGCINQSGLLTLKVTKSFGESTVSKITDLVENASARKAPTENFITTFARYYTPVVVGMAAVLAIIPPLVLGGGWSEWLRRGFVFLIVSCPCALVISIPLTFFGGIGAASKRGVLVKGSNYLEALNKVSVVVFDKTGTLTKGVFEVANIIPAAGYQKEQVLEYAAQAESYSNHPIAKSILATYGKPIDQKQFSGFEEISGHGISVMVQGKKVLAGNSKLMESEKIAYAACDAAGTKFYVAADGSYVGCILIADEVKPDSKCAIAELKKIGVEKTVMLTGDDERIGKSVADELGLDAYYAQLLPDQKVEKLEMLDKQKRQGSKLAFVGDGINDAAAMKASDVGISVDTAVDIAKESANVILLEKDLMVLEDGVLEGRKTFGNINKYIKMTASSNFGNMFSVMFASAFLPFLPMMPIHLLIQNLLYDISQTTIPFDRMDPEFLRKPRKWDASDLKRFMIYIGPISSIFDIVTYLVMWHVFGCNSPEHQSLFQSGWFIEGLLSQTLIVHMIRTRKIPFIQSRATWPVIGMTTLVMVIGIVIPFTSFGASIGLQALPLSYFPWLVGILLSYCVLTQLVKNWYIRKFSGWL